MTLCLECNEGNPERARFCWSCGARLRGQVTAEPEVRKTVTVVFCDVTGSTALGERLDPESLHGVMAQYHDRMRERLERHGGTVEKFIGDAVVAVFGIPTLHEDDPVRAVRAATEMAEAVQALNVELQRSWGVTIQIRTGVNTGEVVVGASTTPDALVMGDAVNVAARLEEAADPGEILLGAVTHQLVRDAVQAEPVAPLRFKGKELPVPAWRLITVTSGVPGHLRQMDSPMVGREDELALLEQAFRRAVRERRCFLFTLLGAAGVGKSRLVAEFLAKADRRAAALGGHCLSYGEGTTFWPVAEVVRQAGGLLDQDPLEVACTKLEALLQQEERSALITKPLVEMVGLTENPAAAHEVSWAMRKLFEALARQRPLVVVFDDLQWAEPTFLDLVEYVADWSRDAALLLICVARPEFLDAHPGWGGGKLNATSILLEPLSMDESEEVVTNLLAGRLAEPTRKRIAEAAEGNPLFIEEFMRMLIDGGLLARSDDQWATTTDLGAIPVPASIQAVLTARLDQLKSEERAVLQRASVVGEVFDEDAIIGLSSKEARPAIREQLLALARKELIRPDYGGSSSEDAFRFRHDLIRDAAYQALPKQHRAQLHERLAKWLERRVGDRLAEYNEILGYHLEQAHRLRAELGPIDEHTQVLAQRAAGRLGEAGRRAFNRGDNPAACNLLRRAVGLLPPQDPAPPNLKAAFGKALFEAGMFDEADAVLAEAATATSDERAARLATVERSMLHVLLRPERVVLDQVRAQAEASITVFTRLNDNQALARSWLLLAEVHGQQCHLAVATEAIERALQHGRQANDAREQGHALAFLALVLDHGPMPAADAIKRCQMLYAEAEGRHWAAPLLGPLAHLEARQNRFQVARELIGQGRSISEEFRLTWYMPWFALFSGKVEFLAGELVAAERELRLGYGMYQHMGEKNMFPVLAVDLAEVHLSQGRASEALRLTEMSEAIAGKEDMWSHILWRITRAKVLAQQDMVSEAERLANEATQYAAQTDLLDTHADALFALAEILRLAGRLQSAGALLEDAARLYRQKGNLAGLSRVKALLEH
jgi:predicted ATPase/class 3 adenylate cyclase